MLMPPLRHWNWIGASPDAVTRREALWPTSNVLLCGWTVITSELFSGGLTVSVAVSLVTRTS